MNEDMQGIISRVERDVISLVYHTKCVAYAKLSTVETFNLIYDGINTKIWPMLWKMLCEKLWYIYCSQFRL